MRDFCKGRPSIKRRFSTAAPPLSLRLAAVFITAVLALADPVASQQHDARPFWPEIQAFMAADQARGVAPCRTLFVGSSSIRLWRDLAADMPGRKIVRRGFGGAHIAHVRRYYDVLIARHQPREILLYAGENDISGGRSPAQVFGRTQSAARRQTAHAGSDTGLLHRHQTLDQALA